MSWQVLTSSFHTLFAVNLLDILVPELPQVWREALAVLSQDGPVKLEASKEHCCRCRGGWEGGKEGRLMRAERSKHHTPHARVPAPTTWIRVGGEGREKGGQCARVLWE